VQQLTRKLLHKKRKKSKFRLPPLSFFKNISQTTKARRLRFLEIDLAKNFAQNPSIGFFLEPPATISATSKTPKTVSLSGGSLVKSTKNVFFVKIDVFHLKKSE
jgi:hypothetical protein